MSWGLNQLTCRVPLGDMLRFYQSDLINLIRPTSFFLRLSITDFQPWRRGHFGCARNTHANEKKTHPNCRVLPSF